MILHVTFQHKDPDYSAAYVVIKTDRIDNVSGYGLAFTLGRGTDIGKFQKYGVASIFLIAAGCLTSTNNYLLILLGNQTIFNLI